MIPITITDIARLLRHVSSAVISTERKRRAMSALRNARRELLSRNPNEDVIEAALAAAKTAGIIDVDVIWTRRTLQKVRVWNGRKKKAVGVRYKKKAAHHKKKAGLQRRSAARGSRSRT